METRTVAGSCFCGAVRFEITLPTTFCVHCHCSMCRRIHGAGYVTWTAVPKSQFKLLSEEAAFARHRSSEHGIRSFCRTCGSNLFCESTQHPESLDIVLACLDGPIDREPQAHIYFDNRVDWMPVDDKLPRLREDQLP